MVVHTVNIPKQDPEFRRKVMHSAMDGWMSSILSDHLTAAKEYLDTGDERALDVGDPQVKDIIDALVNGRWWNDEAGIGTGEPVNPQRPDMDAFWVHEDDLDGRPITDLYAAKTREEACRWLLEAWDRG